MQWALFLSASLEFQCWNKSQEPFCEASTHQGLGLDLKKVADSTMPGLVLAEGCAGLESLKEAAYH